MKKDNIYDPADMLELVGRVEAPPFLLTRIRQRIENVRQQKVSPGFAWAATLSFLLVLSVNVYIMAGGAGKMEGRGRQVNLAQTMNLFPDNSLYE
jgi:hypothetical protein